VHLIFNRRESGLEDGDPSLNALKIPEKAAISLETLPNFSTNEFDYIKPSHEHFRDVPRPRHLALGSYFRDLLRS
jgi:hypothetical protein